MDDDDLYKELEIDTEERKEKFTQFEKEEEIDQ